MTKKQLAGQLAEIAGQDAVLLDEPMKKHTTFRIGGPADIFVSPPKAEMAAPILQACEAAGVPWFILGNGSNLLVSDDGFRGVVVRIDSNLQKIYPPVTDPGTGRILIRAEAGALLSKIAACARDISLEGMAFASGIPGTLGGAVTMNAGAYGGEMKQVLRRVRLLDRQLCECIEDAGRLELGYRTSRVKTEGLVVLEAELSLMEGDRVRITEEMDRLREERTSKQPLEYPSAGSTFKRPEGYFAGKLIMDAGLRGAQVGGAQVSEKHCGFVINRGGATADDVRRLMKHIRETVYGRFGVMLEPEVRFLGFSDDAGL